MPHGLRQAGAKLRVRVGAYQPVRVRAPSSPPRRPLSVPGHARACQGMPHGLPQCPKRRPASQPISRLVRAGCAGLAFDSSGEPWTRGIF
eukprot:scaffold48843_cov30-Phaeocystis_antarctica.AAC.1